MMARDAGAGQIVKLLVTGGSGLLGSNLVRLARERHGTYVTMTVHTWRPEGAVGAEWVTLDLVDRDRATAAGWTTAARVLGAVTGLALFGFLVEQLGGFLRAGAVLWLPLISLVGLYALLPETRGTELEGLDWAPT